MLSLNCSIYSFSFNYVLKRPSDLSIQGESHEKVNIKKHIQQVKVEKQILKSIYIKTCMIINNEHLKHDKEFYKSMQGWPSWVATKLLTIKLHCKLT